MTKKLFCIITILVLVFVTKAFSFQNKKIIKANKVMLIEQQIAQKIMLDLRYYCPEMTIDTANFEGEENTLEGAQYTGNNPNIVKVNALRCLTPLTKLPPELADLITSTGLGGVILFADNLQNTDQIIQLTSELQNAALKSTSKLPLFISVDQEGGRVVRLPRNIATSFTGNMAIGATYVKHGVTYAKAVGEAIGSELNALGFNVNHAPDVDVNINPNNPVINVRSFGESPKMVADLGIAMLEGMQSKGIIGTLKHFPGHGDTNTDSHTGLPIVNHDIGKVEKVDLYPFQKAIDQSNVEMIMTAHIQYPALDNSIIVNKHGESMIKPATLSKKILTDLLRNKMGYQGLIVTDALDMAGISDFFTPVEAVLNTFKAGADIAIMPMKIRKPADIETFKNFIKLLSEHVKKDPATLIHIQQSVERIVKLKVQLPTNVLSAKQVNLKINLAKEVLANRQHRALEESLATNSIVEIKNNLITKHWYVDIKNVHIIFPEQGQSNAMKLALINKLASLGKSTWQITTSNLEHFELNKLYQQIDRSDLIIVATDNQKTSVEMGGVENFVQQLDKTRSSTGGEVFSKNNYAEKTLSALMYAKQYHKKTILITLKSPYKIAQFAQFSDCIFSSFNGNFYQNLQGNFIGPVFNTLSDIIAGELPAKGQLPVSINID